MRKEISQRKGLHLKCFFIANIVYNSRKLEGILCIKIVLLACL